MTKKTMYLTGLLAVSAVLSTQAQNVMVSDYEDITLQGWGGGNVVSSVATAPDASLGGYSMLVSVDSQYSEHVSLATWNSGSQLSIANLNAGSSISFDLYFPSAGWAVNHANVGLEVWTGDTWTDIFGYQSLTSLTKDSVIHMSFDLSSFSMPRTGASWGGIDIFVNTEYDWMWDTVNNGSAVPFTAQQVYVDNVQIIAPVPEPSTMALAVAGGAALLFFRRRTIR